MKFTNLIGALALVAGLSACATVGGGSSGNAADPVSAVPAELTALSAQWRLSDVRVNVSEDLSVSEANLYYPVADIVWREDPFGDRRAQVAKIVDDGMTAGLTHLKGPQRVFFDVNLHRFHSLSEKARYSIGGVHNIIYTLTVVDAATGAALHSPIKMEIDLKAYGGDEALAAERKGLTQKVRIQSHLASVMRQAFNGGQEMRVVAQADEAS
ncbi:DUF6778 family protein [Litoreibacter arenae]|uniref:Lipoprotein, putative n=1 Tax=Litoreibacter arenae DSM 19593 TaxID=1123360 RepID=S9RT89_9RHOB|nr:DUF6778 family protein [Litoreibacter arenae]EPX81295.1 lipoprotein, putative [Litoreibacter arenae DSM 19593]